MIQKLILTSSIILLSQASLALDNSSIFSDQIKNALKEKIPYAEIRVPNLEKLAKTVEIEAIHELIAVRVVEERSNGVALIELISRDGNNVRIQTPYQALVKVPVAIQRIFPNTKLKKEDFRLETINVATGTAKDYRGVIVYDLNSLSQVETKQTILENQFVLSSQIQKSPDLRKGETVQVEISSGELSLMTAATVLENASIGESVRVLTAKTKKEISGKVREDRTIEVRI